jgi:UDP-N-acetylmuramoyl-L-alanyl-D-glutamate--2,6-diaminopimelate ligase
MLVQDSRQVSDGDVFIAIQGSQMDGHNFIPQAIQNGAKVIITMQVIPDNEDVCFVRVEDTRELLGPLAQAFKGNPARDMTLIGITGTNGKTTVATLTYQILRELDAKPALLGTIEKRIGDEIFESKLTTSDPIELAADMRKMVDAGTSHMIMEVSSHALDQGRVDGLKFQVAAFTNLSHDHLDYHKTVEAYAKSKKQLFDHLDRDSWAIINGDDEQADFMLSDCMAQTVRFSFKESLDVECQILSNTTEGLTVRIGKTMIESPLAGKFNAYNIAEAFLICEALGYPGEKIARILKTATGAAGRLEKVQVSSKGNEPTVMVDYAHTPDALRNVSETLASLKNSNLEKKASHLIWMRG